MISNTRMDKSHEERPSSKRGVLAYYASFWKNSLNWSGRTGKREYSYISFVNCMGGVVFIIVPFVLAYCNYPIPILKTIGKYWLLASIVPWITLKIRRLHDVSRSGLTLLLILVPYSYAGRGPGWLILCHLCDKEGDHGWNKYGPEPDP